jgi:hypothetical protein
MKRSFLRAFRRGADALGFGSGVGEGRVMAFGGFAEPVSQAEGDFCVREAGATSQIIRKALRGNAEMTGQTDLAPVRLELRLQLSGQSGVSCPGMRMRPPDCLRLERRDSAARRAPVSAAISEAAPSSPHSFMTKGIGVCMTYYNINTPLC